MDTPLTAGTRSWIEGSVGGGARLHSATLLEGATSATVVALELRRSGRPLELILRLFSNAGWLAEEPDLAAHEAAVLRWLAGNDLPVPELVAVDESGRACGVPAILMSKVAGRVDLLPNDPSSWLEQQAEALARIHALPHQGFGWRYRSWTPDDPRVPGWSAHPERWRRALELWRRGPPREADRFLHRDYHPMNTLWRRGRLSGIVDWVNACVGPAAVDLSHCRGNLVLMFGPDAADRFLSSYQQRVPEFVYHPYWDLEVLVDWLPEPGVYGPWHAFGLSELTPELMRSRSEALLERVLAHL